MNRCRLGRYNKLLLTNSCDSHVSYAGFIVLLFYFMFQILAAESPNRVSLIEDSMGESSDSDDDLPLSSALVAVHPPEPTPQPNSYPRSPEDNNSETEAEQSGVREITRVIDTLNSASSTSSVSNHC